MHLRRKIYPIVIMACIYIMPFIPKHFSNYSIVNLIKSFICRVYLHNIFNIVCETPLKRCHHVFMLRDFIRGDHFFPALLLNTVNAHLWSIFKVGCKIHSKNQRPHKMTQDIKKLFGFALHEITCQIISDFTGVHHSLDPRGMKKLTHFTSNFN